MIDADLIRAMVVALIVVMLIDALGREPNDR